MNISIFSHDLVSNIQTRPVLITSIASPPPAHTRNAGWYVIHGIASLSKEDFLLSPLVMESKRVGEDWRLWLLVVGAFAGNR